MTYAGPCHRPMSMSGVLAWAKQRAAQDKKTRYVSFCGGTYVSELAPPDDRHFFICEPGKDARFCNNVRDAERL